MPLKTSDEKQNLILKVFDYFEAESKLSLGESEISHACLGSGDIFKLGNHMTVKCK